MNYLVVIVFVIIGIAALIFAQRMAQKEHQKRLIAAKCKRLLQRANEIWDTITLTSKYIKDGEVIDTLVKYYEYYIQKRE